MTGAELCSCGCTHGGHGWRDGGRSQGGKCYTTGCPCLAFEEPTPPRIELKDPETGEVLGFARVPRKSAVPSTEELRAENAGLLARIAALEDALEPFAKIAEIIDEAGAPVNDHVQSWSTTKGEAKLLRSDLSCARATLESRSK